MELLRQFEFPFYRMFCGIGGFAVDPVGVLRGGKQTDVTGFAIGEIAVHYRVFRVKTSV
jgi:hypothetical protein